MFMFGFWCGIIGVLLVESIIITVTLILAYKGAPIMEDDGITNERSNTSE